MRRDGEAVRREIFEMVAHIGIILQQPVQKLSHYLGKVSPVSMHRKHRSSHTLDGVGGYTTRPNIRGVSNKKRGAVRSPFQLVQQTPFLASERTGLSPAVHLRRSKRRDWTFACSLHHKCQAAGSRETLAFFLRTSVSHWSGRLSICRPSKRKEWDEPGNDLISYCFLGE